MICKLLISPFYDPCLNLAMEHVLLETLEPEEEILFLYTNDPAVVIGRFQNPWLESSPGKRGAPQLIRRESGGGTVYHDRGNLNFSFIQNIENYNRKENLIRICTLMKGCRINLNINERNDLTIDYSGNSYKVSGSAFRHKKDRAFHHGTLLISSETDKLKQSITPGDQRIFTSAKGTASNRSEIINLNRINPEITLETVVNLFRSYYSRTEGMTVPERGREWWSQFADRPDVSEVRTMLQSEEWTLGKTPGFSQVISFPHSPETEHWEIKVSRGVIVQAPRELSFLEGIPYGMKKTKEQLKQCVRGRSVSGLGEDELFSRLISIIG
ncbi:MAG: hypothetical protein PQJ58_16935 [Spirochaetales bacterium]|nr:hypothetical protein [Spirochaetales bacterium]